VILALIPAGCGDNLGPCDGALDVGEECDDGNFAATDGCDCRHRAPWPAPYASDDPLAPIVIEEDGAWSWFQDERVVLVGDRVIVGTVSHQGNVQVSAADLATGVREHATLRGRFERDDHDAPTLLPLPDGRLLAFYTRHDGFKTMYWRATTGESVDEWGAEGQLSIDNDVTYSNPMLLAGDGDAAARVWLFFRGMEYNPSFTVSDDLGESWAPVSQAIRSYDIDVSGRDYQRPYVKYVSDGVDTIHLFYTQGHPREIGRTSLFHLYYRDGALHRSDGTVVGAMRPGRGPRVAPHAGTLIHDGGKHPDGEAWPWDAAIDADGHPIVVFATYPAPGRELDVQHYRYARWDGAEWTDQLIGDAGTALYPAETFYSGGAALDPDDPSVVYVSADVDPATGEAVPSGHHEIWRGDTDDGGATWRFRAITAGSIADNLRPVVPAGHRPGTAVVWMQGTYESYVDWDTRIVGLFAPADAIATSAVPEEPLVALARFDVVVGGAPTAPGYVAARADGSTMSARDADVTLEVRNVTADRDDGSLDPLHRDAIVCTAGGLSARNKLHVSLAGLEPHHDYIVRLHGHQRVLDYLLPTLWFRGDGWLDLDRNLRFVGAHRLTAGRHGGDGQLSAMLRADAEGRIDLVARGLDDIGGQQTAVLNALEVFARPATTRAARFDLDPAPGVATALGQVSLAIDEDTWIGRATDGGITVTVSTDRALASRLRGEDEGQPAADFVFGLDGLIVDIEGLEVGGDYEVTVLSQDLGDNVFSASRWRLDAPGMQPIVVRGFQVNARSLGPASSFTFYHHATSDRFRLRATDVLYSESGDPSFVIFGGIEIGRLAP
jgi:hypothetical protein